MSIFISFSKWSPRGLFARSLLIIVLPIAIMQILITYLFFDLHWGKVSFALAKSTASNIAYITNKYEADPTSENLAKLQNDANSYFGFSFTLDKGQSLPPKARHIDVPAYDRTLKKAINSQVNRPYWFDTIRYYKYVDIRVKVKEGILHFLVNRDNVFASTGGIFLMWIIGATTLLTTVSILFIRNQIRPMERLADAAERFGRGESVYLKPAGSREVRRAAHAFLEMRARIARHIEQRTNILAGVSHDLRTPLTRLKLELALLPKSANIEAAKHDIRQMEDLLEEYLSFAKGEWAGQKEETDLSLIAKMAFDDSSRNNSNIINNIHKQDINVSIKPTSIKRCLDNLISNALAHGNNVSISADKDNEFGYIFIDDDGAGLPESSYEEALNPFTRLEGARNMNKKGVGLGLSIARDIARSHGGELQLSQSPMGGLRASLKLPLIK